MKYTVKAFAPGNISLLFKVMPDPDPAKAGSLGAGFTVNEGALVSVQQGVNRVTYNKKHIDLPTVSEVKNNLTTVDLSIDITSPLPLGSGFGLSGSSALASAYAINALFKLKKTPLELVKIAHRAEVVHKTGLGDVGNEWQGGCCVKFITSSLFQMERLPFVGTIVYARSWGKIATPSILSNTPLLRAIDSAGDNVLAYLKKRMHQCDFTFNELLDISNTFTKESGLIQFAPHAQKVIKTIKQSGGHATMIILGDAVVSTHPFEGSNKLRVIDYGVGVIET